MRRHPPEPTEPANPAKPAEPVRLAEHSPSDPASGDSARADHAVLSASGELHGVLFDMDGLIVDSEPLWFEVECAVMARLGGQWGGTDQQAHIRGARPRTTP